MPEGIRNERIHKLINVRFIMSRKGQIVHHCCTVYIYIYSRISFLIWFYRQICHRITQKRKITFNCSDFIQKWDVYVWIYFYEYLKGFEIKRNSNDIMLLLIEKNYNFLHAAERLRFTKFWLRIINLLLNELFWTLIWFKLFKWYRDEFHFQSLQCMEYFNTTNKRIYHLVNKEEFLYFS